MRVNLNYHNVEKLFEDSEKEPVVELYRMVFPDFDNFEKVEGWPTINRETSEKISRLCIEYDRKHSPKTVAGGIWLNWGFSNLEAEKLGLKNWEVETSTCDIIYKK